MIDPERFAIRDRDRRPRQVQRDDGRVGLQRRRDRRQRLAPEPVGHHPIEIDELPQTETPLMLNVASPDLAFKYSFLPNKGVGLAREEFIINNYIKVHPLALLMTIKGNIDKIRRKTAWGKHDREGFNGKTDKKGRTTRNIVIGGSIAAAAAAIRAVGREPVREEIYELVAGIEGHGDNAAPAVYGGLMAVGSNGPHRLVMNPDILPVAGIPETRLPTRRARQVVPDEVPMAAASRNVGRAVLLVEALRTGDPSAFAAAAGDEFHEAARAALSPTTTAMIDAARSAGALHAAWSGAGPTTLALVTVETRAAVIDALKSVLGGSGVVQAVSVDFEGLR